MLNKADAVEYIYSVHENDTKVYVDLYLYRAVAQSGFFGLKYDPEAIRLESFDYAKGFSTVGMTIQDGGYGCFKNEDGIYADAYLCKANAEACNMRVLIGTFTFSKVSDIDCGIAFADACEYGADKILGYPAGAEGAYIPHIESFETVMQPAIYSVEQKAVAYIGNKEYDSLEEAMENAVDGDTVKLEAKASLTSNVAVPAGVTLYADERAEIDGGKIVIADGGKVVSEKQIYGFLTAETYVGMLFDEEVFRYVKSEYHKNVLSLYGVQVRTQGVQGLRFIANFIGDKEEIAYSDYGLIVLPCDLSEKENTTHYT